MDHRAIVQAICLTFSLLLFIHQAHAADCSPNAVVFKRNVVTVLPSGGNDTDNLQCALDAAIAAGKGAIVQLAAGTFHTTQLRVFGFDGAVRGAGEGLTIIENAGKLQVTYLDFDQEPPSAAHPWPSLLAFVDGDIAISDLSIRIVGSAPTSGWSIFGLPTISSLAHAIVIVGTHAKVNASRVSISGEPSADWLYGYNLYNGIFYEGFLGPQFAPLSGSFSVSDSHFEALQSGTPIANLRGATVKILNNVFTNVQVGMDGGDFSDTSYSFVGNEVNGVALINLVDVGLQAHGATNSSLLIGNNTVIGTYGPMLQLSFAGEIACKLVHNDTSGVDEVSVWLDTGTRGCLVVTDDAARVVDLGTDNKIVATH